jgi:CDP-diglyceride synthetase
VQPKHSKLLLKLLSEDHPAKTVEGMVGEFFREVAVLVLVFAILDKFGTPKETKLYVFCVALVSLASLGFGMYLEYMDSKGDE